MTGRAQGLQSLSGNIALTVPWFKDIEGLRRRTQCRRDPNRKALKNPPLPPSTTEPSSRQSCSQTAHKASAGTLCMFACRCICMLACTCSCKYVYKQTSKYNCMLYVHMYIDTHLYIHIYICIFFVTRTRQHIYTHKWLHGIHDLWFI